MEPITSQFLFAHATEIRLLFAIIAVAFSLGLLKVVIVLDRWISSTTDNARRAAATARAELDTATAR